MYAALWSMHPKQVQVVPTIPDLRAHVDAAQHEFALAVAFHEVWKPSVHDEELHAPLGRSYASQAFEVIRTALRREMLLELMRVWDTSSGEQHVKIDSTFDHLSVTCSWPHMLTNQCFRRSSLGRLCSTDSAAADCLRRASLSHLHHSRLARSSVRPSY